MSSPISLVCHFDDYEDDELVVLGELPINSLPSLCQVGDIHEPSIDLANQQLLLLSARFLDHFVVKREEKRVKIADFAKIQPFSRNNSPSSLSSISSFYVEI